MQRKWWELARSTETYSVYVCNMHQNVVLLVETIEWDVAYKDVINKVVWGSANKGCAMNRYESHSLKVQP